MYPVYVIQSVSLLSLHHALSFGLTHVILSLLPILMHIHTFICKRALGIMIYIEFDLLLMVLMHLCIWAYKRQRWIARSVYKQRDTHMEALRLCFGFGKKNKI